MSQSAATMIRSNQPRLLGRERGETIVNVAKSMVLHDTGKVAARYQQQV